MFLFSSQQIIHQTNQQKIENELQILNSMINKVREVRDPVVFFLTPCVPFVSWITQMYLSSCFYLFIYFIPADAPVFARRCAEMRPAPTAGWIHRMICLWLLSSWFIYIVLFMFYADWIKWFFFFFVFYFVGCCYIYWSGPIGSLQIFMNLFTFLMRRVFMVLFSWMVVRIPGCIKVPVQTFINIWILSFGFQNYKAKRIPYYCFLFKMEPIQHLKMGQFWLKKTQF